MTPIPPQQRERFADLGRASRVWAVGAIHGEVDRLRAIHGALAERFAPGDRLVYLGNMMGRGSDVRATIDELIDFRRILIARRRVFAADVVFLRGAQEEMWQKSLELQFASNPREVLQWMMDQGLGPTLSAYGSSADQGFGAGREGARALTRWTSQLRASLNSAPGHSQLMTALRRAALTSDGKLLFVSAGVAPGRPLDAQGDAFWWSGHALTDMADPFAGFARVVRGYDRRGRGLVEGAFAVSLDGGCGVGGTLLAACLDADGKVAEVLQA